MRRKPKVVKLPAEDLELLRALPRFTRKFGSMVSDPYDGLWVRWVDVATILARLEKHET